MRILVTGASGMLGSSLAMELSNSHEVFGTGNSQVSLPIEYKIFDLSNESYKELLEWSNPELIIHCAALTNGNYCDNNPLDAFSINGFSSRKLINASKDNVKIIYISTDAIFPNSLHLAKEVDYPSPQSIYGKSKELGEFFLTNSKREYIIIRTTIVGLNYYTNNTGFVEWILNSVRSKEYISLFDDVKFTPISIWDLIREIKFLINKKLFESKILHIAGKEIITKYEFGKLLLDQLGLDKEYIRKGYISDFKKRAKRSNDQSLDSSYYEKKFKRKVPAINKTILTLKNKINE